MYLIIVNFNYKIFYNINFCKTSKIIFVKFVSFQCFELQCFISSACVPQNGGSKIQCSNFLAFKGNENNFILKNNNKKEKRGERERVCVCLTILHIFVLHALPQN